MITLRDDARRSPRLPWTACAPTGTHREQLKIAVPYDVAVDVTLDALKEL
ncbi:hypothetical protein [Streptomyces sp. NPDC003487]